jgi:(S)-ureidoglycine aminohydrolase
MITKLGMTRTVVTPSYALVAPDGHVLSVLPGWTRCSPVVLVSAAMGAAFSQYLVALEASGRGDGDTGADEWVFFVVEGAATINGASLNKGGFAYVPPAQPYVVRSATEATVLLVFRKTYEPLSGHPPPAMLTGHEHDVTEAPLLDDSRVRLKVLIPDSPGTDIAVNILTYDPGATLPFVETHVMEHGMLFLAGGGVYRLNVDWHPVTLGDAIWIAPYCAQWFIAAGPEPARYIYYKNVNRLP